MNLLWWISTWFGFNLSTPSTVLPSVRVARVKSLQRTYTVQSLTNHRVRSLSQTKTVQGVP